jgi:hypothetical protein
MHPDLFEVTPAPKPIRVVSFDDDQRDSLGVTSAIGLGDDDNQFRVLAGGNERLLAIDEINVSIAGRGRR